VSERPPEMSKPSPASFVRDQSHPARSIQHRRSSPGWRSVMSKQCASIPQVAIVPFASKSTRAWKKSASAALELPRTGRLRIGYWRKGMGWRSAARRTAGRQRSSSPCQAAGARPYGAAIRESSCCRNLSSGKPRAHARAQQSSEHCGKLWPRTTESGVLS
jgi:hypothetical protein